MKKYLNVLLVVSCIFVLHATAQIKILDTTAYKDWKSLSIPVLSNDGNWVIYNENKPGAVKNLVNVGTGRTIKITGSGSLEFFNGGKWVRYDKGSDSVILYRLKDGKILTRNRKVYFSLSSWNGNLLYKKNTDLVVFDVNKGDSIILEKADRYTLFEQDKSILYLREHQLVWGMLRGEKKMIHEQVSDYFFNPVLQTGTFLSGSKLFYFSLRTGKQTELLDFSQLNPPGKYKILTKAYDYRPETRDLLLEAMPDEVSRNNPGKKMAANHTSGFDLELWTWNEAVSQRLQKKGAAARQRPKQPVFIYHLDQKSWFEIPAENDGHVAIPKGDHLPYVIVYDPLPYMRMVDFRYESNVDLYSLNTATGQKKVIANDSYTLPQWGPNGYYAVLYDRLNKKWNVFDPGSATLKPFSDQIGHPVYNEEHDMPRPAEAYGLAGWVDNGKRVVVYDRYDLWVIDLSGTSKPWSPTGGYGRAHQITFRLQGSEFNDQLDLSRPLLLTSFNEKTKSKGLYRLLPDHQIKKLYDQQDYSVKIISIAANGSFVYTKQNYSTFPDIWWANEDFKVQKRISDVNPQQKDYNWGSVKVITWKTFEGKSNQGLLYLPENYDPAKTYPAIVDFYETHSQGLHEYFPPIYSTAVINIPTYVSQGYIVFRPDVHFKIGDPGESAYNCVLSGTQFLIDRGVIDAKHVGLQGHSWSGYEAAYLVTRSHLFTCANLGAAVSNMTYNYFAIRANGAPCMFKYEVEQSRIGKNLWEDQAAYLRNSPIFNADKITSPLLIFHNDKDGAVAFTQGLDLFLAMRRLQKPAWLLNYKGEGHTLDNLPAQQDWTLRMRQFFDHYLKEAPEPRWMKEGINVDERGVDEKYDF